MKDSQFGEIISQYERLVYTICYQFTHDHHTAEDLAQETFLSAYAHRESCPVDCAKPWLARIAANKAKDHLKSAYHRHIQVSAEDSLPENRPVLFIGKALPEDIAISKEAVQAIRDEILALREPYRMVAEMFFLQDKSVEEIARVLERPPKTVHTQLYRAKHFLQEKIKEVDYGAV